MKDAKWFREKYHNDIEWRRHKKDGQPHSRNCEQTWQKIKDNPEDWVRLCGRCHDSIHWIMKHFHLSWNEIKSKLDSFALV